MKKSPYAIVIIILIVIFSFNSNLGQIFTDDSSITNNTYISETITYNFRNSDYLHEHYEKHKDEFDNLTESEYLAHANALINSQSPEILTKTEKEDGDLVYYNPENNEFLILSTDGYIRTFFKPDDGIEYYNRK